MMNKRQTKKAFKRMQESQDLWLFYINKKFSKCYVREWKRRCEEHNRKAREEGSSVFYAPYLMCPFTPTVGNYPSVKEIASRYVKVECRDYPELNALCFDIKKEI